MEEKEILRQLKTSFFQLYGEGEVRIFFAPGRVNLIGEHTDYNGGHVFPCALTIGTYAAVRLREDRRVRFSSMNLQAGEITEVSLEEAFEAKTGDWTNYPKGVFWAFEEAGHKIESGMDLLYYGNIPAGSGLSSSASLEVLTGLVLKEMLGLKEVSQQDLAVLGQKAECDFVGMKCGIMDQFASAMGKKDAAIFLETNKMEFDYLPLALEQAKIVITNSLVKHELASSEYNVRRQECEQAVRFLNKELKIQTLGQLTCEQFEEKKHLIPDEIIQKRAKHAVYENQRTIQAVEALKKKDIEAFGRLMNASHISLRDDYAVSCPEIDVLTELAWKISGVQGSRITGGGFGGCTVSIVKDEAIDTFQKEISKAYEEKYGKVPEFYIVSAGEGAHEIVND